MFRDYQSSKMSQLFQAANLYLGESLPTISIPLMVEKTENVRNLTFCMEKNSEMIDVFENVPRSGSSALNMAKECRSTRSDGTSCHFTKSAET